MTCDLRRILIPVLSTLLFAHAFGCQCPPVELSMSSLEQYQVIFRGTVKSVTVCGTKPGEAVFQITELFRGKIPADFSVHYDCGECATGFNEGEEWIIYSNFRQVNNARMDWCSRSRKYFRHEKEDFYLVNTGTSYFGELEFLRTHLGHHRLVAGSQNQAGDRNIKPDQVQTIVILLLSILAMVVFYALFRRFFR